MAPGARFGHLCGGETRREVVAFVPVLGPNAEVLRNAAAEAATVTVAAASSTF